MREGAAYLQGQPRFSQCTVPIIWYPFERLNNFAHLFRWVDGVALCLTWVTSQVHAPAAVVQHSIWGGRFSYALLLVSHCRDNGARLLGAIQETPWAAQHAKMVLMTAEVNTMCLWVMSWFTFPHALLKYALGAGADACSCVLVGCAATACVNAPPLVQGTALHRHTHTILQPLFRLRLETWADFSTRLPARQVGAAVAERLGSSGEGGRL